MTMLTILTAGPYTSMQDKGRTGYQALGVPEGGTVDPDARITANWLVSQWAGRQVESGRVATYEAAHG